MKIMSSFWSSCLLVKRYVFLALVFLALSGCSFILPDGYQLSESEVQYLRGSGYTLAFKDVVRNHPASGRYWHDVHCKLESPKILPAKSVEVRVWSNKGSIHNEFYDSEEFTQAEVGQWKMCKRQVVNRTSEPFRFDKWEVVRLKGCSSYLDGVGLPDGSRVFGEMCAGKLVSGVQIKATGDILKCNKVDGDEKITVLGERQEMRCSEIAGSGEIRSVNNYLFSYYSRPSLSGIQLRGSNSGLIAQYAQPFEENIVSLEGEVSKEANKKVNSSRAYYEKQEAKRHDQEISKLNTLIGQKRDEARHLTHVKKEFGSQNLVKQCTCTYTSCLRRVSSDSSKRLTDSEWRALSASKDDMCRALQKAGVIKVESTDLGMNIVRAGDGTNSVNIQKAFESNDFSGLNISGDAGELFREAQKEHNEIKRLIAKRQKAVRDKEQAIKEVAERLELERKDRIAAQVAESKKKALMVAEKAQEDLVDFKICLSRYGIDYDTRANWSALPSDCM